MILPRFRNATLVLLLGGIYAVAQTVPNVSFSLDFPGSEPEHYVIMVSEDGHASYESTGKLNPDNSQTPHTEFMASEATRKRIFDLAKQAHYFEGEVDSRNKKLAFTGSKVLTYKDSAKTTEAKYNYSPVPAVQQLTQFFQSLSATLEFGRRLRYYHRYQKLALNEELKRMEASKETLQEISAVGPILNEIAKDPSVMNIDRARALRLLDFAKSAAP